MNCVIFFIFILLWICNSEDKIKKEVDLVELGQNITETIQHPSGKADDLIGNIYKYYEALEIMHNGMKKEDKLAIKAFFELSKIGGPSFLKLMPVDEKPLEEFYKWKTYHGIEFRGFLKYNVDEWNNMIEYAKEHKLCPE